MYPASLGRNRPAVPVALPPRRLLSYSVKFLLNFFLCTAGLLSSWFQQFQKRRVLASKRFQIDFLVVWDALLPTAIDNPDPFVGQRTDRRMMVFAFVYLHLVIGTRP